MRRELEHLSADRTPIVAADALIMLQNSTSSKLYVRHRTVSVRYRTVSASAHWSWGEAQLIHNKTSSLACFAFELQIFYLSNIETARGAMSYRQGELTISAPPP